jgi:phosphoribosyl 1,2-cyclic phosphate phosphodiesterase
MRVTFLGTGTSTGVPVLTCSCEVCRSEDPRDRRLRPSVLLEWDGASVLIDTSTDLRQQALARPIQRVDAVLYTHHHADHVLGLDELRLYNWRQRGAVPVYGRAETLDALRRTFWYVFEDVQGGGAKPAVTTHAVHGPFPLFGRRIVPVPVLHGTLPIDGFRVDDFAYLTDVSTIPAPSYALLQGLDVLVLNALRPRPHPTHLHLEAAIAEARRIGARRTLFTHLGHEMPHAAISAGLPEGIELAYDGQVLELADFGEIT